MSDDELKIITIVHDEAENGAAADGILPEHPVYPMPADPAQDAQAGDDAPAVPAADADPGMQAGDDAPAVPAADADPEMPAEADRLEEEGEKAAILLEESGDEVLSGDEEDDDDRPVSEDRPLADLTAAPEDTAAEDPDAEEADVTEAPDVTEDGEMPLPLFGPGPGDEAEEKRVPVVGVRFRPAGKIYYFDPGTLALEHDTHVVVDTVKGADFGIVSGKPFMLPACNMKQPLRRVLRIAEEADEKRRSDNLENEKSAFKICQEKIRQHGLDMKLTSAEYAFDGSKIMFYFTADGRIDFRDLVKDLAGVFHTRIELRQIGVRDETRSIGGYGVCGRPLCCASYLTDFIPVSIKMAKEQNLSLNPGKISGVCGRLMCCLKNEEETYEELNKPLPGIGDEVQGNDGLVGEVISVDVLRQRIRIIVEVNDEKEIHAYGVDEFTITRKRRRGQSRVSMSRGDQGHGSQGAARSGDAPEEGAGAGGRGRRPAHTGRRGQSGQDRNGAGTNSTQDSVQNSAQDGSRDRQGREERPNRRGDRPTDRPSDRSGERPGQGQQGQDGRGTRRGRRGGRDGAQRGGSPAGAGSPTAAGTENVQPADPSAGSVLPDVVTDSFDDGE